MIKCIWCAVVWCAGFAGAGYFALTGSLPGIINTIQSSTLLGFPLRFAISFTIIYHLGGGLRHIVWDHAKIGNQTDKTSMFELPKVELSSKILFAGAAGLAFICALL